MMPLFVQRTMRLLMVYLVMQRLLRECYCYIYCPNMRQFVTPDLQINIAKVLSRCLENVELCINGIKIPRETSCKVPEFNNTSDIGKPTKAGNLFLKSATLIDSVWRTGSPC